MQGSHYQTLGLPLTATPDDIRCAHRRLARLTHPDRRHLAQQASAGSDDVAKMRFQQVQQAYEGGWRLRGVHTA
jgi:curved DNA-binding protein CbpA